MTDYMEYIKGGDILIAPSLDYEYQYILKCGLCEEYYGEFEQFFSHYLSHYDMESNDEDDNLSASGVMDEQQLYDNIIEQERGDEMEDKANEEVATMTEHMSESEGEDTKFFFSEEFEFTDENVDVKDETASLEEKVIVTNSKMQDVLNEPLEVVELASGTHDVHPENEESFDELLVEEKTSNAECKSNIEYVKTFIKEEKSNMEYIKTFMKSQETVTALIEAYRNESHLWNFSLPAKYRKKAKRIMTWNKIASDLKDTKNINMNSDQVATCIIYLRQKYRERKRNSDLVAKDSNDVLPTWAFKQLHFLNPFVESKPVALLDAHQDLSPKQTIQILNIFQRCSHLWDTNTAEYYCTNKRKEALVEMKNLIAEEMDLEVEEESLSNYLQRIRDYVVLEKRRSLGINSAVRDKAKCHNHLIFLYDHVGPFKCSRCRRTVLSPYALKAHEAQHDGTIPFKCFQCDKEFKIAETYVYHIRRHMGDLNEECKECGKKFLRLSDLEEHMRCHTGAKPFCCEVCGASFRQRTGFGMHMKRHGKKYISFCPYCSKGFYSKDAMNMHSKSHTDERDFVCPTCGKAFKTRKTLKSHVAIHENGNYECTLCGKSFKNRINMWQHKRKHRLNSSPQLTSELLSPFDKN